MDFLCIDKGTLRLYSKLRLVYGTRFHSFLPSLKGFNSRQSFAAAHTLGSIIATNRIRLPKQAATWPVKKGGLGFVFSTIFNLPTGWAGFRKLRPSDGQPCGYIRVVWAHLSQNMSCP